MKLSEHFDSSEFKCSCCGKEIKMSSLLIERLEKLFELMGARAIYITSGYRCNNNPYGSPTDAHRKGLAADIKVETQENTFYTGADIAEAAERIGFGGIGIMEPDACHVDTRDSEAYLNNHWFGNETTKDDYIKTFQRGTKFPGESTSEKKKSIEVSIKIDDHTYSGLISEL